jgi:hypothetical protein
MEESKLIDTKMLEMEHDVRNPHESQQKQNEEDEIMNEYDDNFVTVQGLFVQSNVDNLIFEEAEISEFTSMTKSNLEQKQFIPYKYDIEFFIKASQDLFDVVTIINQSDESEDIEMDIEGINIQYRKTAELLECKWIANPKCDLITDAIGLLAIQLCKLILG